MKFIILLGIFLVTALHSFSQTLSVDSLFNIAREKAFSGNRKEAIQLCNLLLSQSPNYTDATVLKARIFSWEKEYSKSKEILYALLEYKKYADAYDALLDAEIWSSNDIQAIKIADSAIFYFPSHGSFYYKKANAYYHLSEFENALKVLDQLLILEPKNEEAIALHAKIKSLLFKNYIRTCGELDLFNKVYDPRQLYNVEYKRNTKLGSCISRVNVANRFNKVGSQVEFDLYPKLKKHYSMYFNYGYSNSQLFPNHRFGMELYKGLRGGTEASLGFRDLIINGNNVLILTGSVSKYWGNYLFTLRPYISPRTNGTSTSVHVLGKKYLNDNLDYFMADVSIGRSPDTKLLYVGNNQNVIYYFKSQQISLTYTKTFVFKAEIQLNTGLQRFELPFQKDSYIYSLQIQLGIKRKF
jgi:YaiO family outer membrane protein